MKENKWQPIESAPKDGNPILIYGTSGRVHYNYWHGGSLNEWWYPAAYRNEEFTHWQPLPEPPEENQ